MFLLINLIQTLKLFQAPKEMIKELELVEDLVHLIYKGLLQIFAGFPFYFSFILVSNISDDASLNSQLMLKSLFFLLILDIT